MVNVKLKQHCLRLNDKQEREVVRKKRRSIHEKFPQRTVEGHQATRTQYDLSILAVACCTARAYDSGWRHARPVRR
jgi:hypothetical protein